MMNSAKYRMELVERKFKDIIKNLEFTDTIKNKLTIYLEKRKINKTNLEYNYDQWELEKQPGNLNRLVHTIREVFGLTAIMSIVVIFMMSVVFLSFFLNNFLDYFRDYGLLTLGIAGVMIGVGWYKPFKLWSVSLTLLGALLLVVSFGPLVIEGYTDRKLVDVNYANGYWLTLKATFVFMVYLIGATTFLIWMYLIAKGRRQNPIKWFRYMKFRTKNES